MTCLRDGCKNAATLLPTVEAWAIGHLPGEHPPARMDFDLPTCQACADRLVVSDLVSAAGAALVQNQLRAAGRLEVDFTKARLVWRPIARVH